MLTTLEQIKTFFDDMAPPELAASWDSVGIQIGHPLDEIKTVLVALEVTLPVLNRLCSTPVDLVVTHHPIFFRPLKFVDTRSDIGRILTTFLTQSMGLFTMHTNLDVVEGGVNDALVNQYGLVAEDGMRIQDGLGLFYAFSEARFSQDLERVLLGRWVGSPCPEKVKRVAFCGGSGRSLLPRLVELGVELYITGELSYHDEVFCEYHGISALLIGHHVSEAFILTEIKSRLMRRFPDLSVTVFGENG